MTPLLTPETLGLLVDEVDALANAAYGDYCIQAASVLVADAAGHPDWIGVASDGTSMTPVVAPRRAVMIAEQLAKRAYKNPDAIVSEGSVGPIGGDRTVEDFARTFEFTPTEAAYLEQVKLDTGLVGTTRPALWTLEIEVRPYSPRWATIWLPDLDPMAKSWPVGTEGVDSWAYGPALT